MALSPCEETEYILQHFSEGLFSVHIQLVETVSNDFLDSAGSADVCAGEGTGGGIQLLDLQLLKRHFISCIDFKASVMIHPFIQNIFQIYMHHIVLITQSCCPPQLSMP